MEIIITEKTLMQLCIPRVEITYKRDYIFNVLCRLKWGHIQSIYETRSKDNENYKRVMINIDWTNKKNTEDLKELLLKGDYINIVHDRTTPFFWRIMMSTYKGSSS